MRASSRGADLLLLLLLLAGSCGFLMGEKRALLLNSLLLTSLRNGFACATRLQARMQRRSPIHPAPLCRPSPPAANHHPSRASACSHQTGTHAQSCELVDAGTQPFAARFATGPVVELSTSSAGVTTSTRKYCFRVSNSVLSSISPAAANSACTAPCCSKEAAKLAAVYIEASKCRLTLP
jgi:hypothetical protein